MIAQRARNYSMGSIEFWSARLGPDVLAEKAQWLPVLAEDERSRFESIRSEHGRIQFLGGRMLLRRALSNHLSVEPGRIKFRYTESGRPELTWPVCDPHLSFNLSYCDGFAVCVIGRECTVGVDVERLDRPASQRLLSTVCSDDELEWLNNSSAWQRRFIQLWTLKEAAIKTKGMEQRVSPKSLNFRLRDDVTPKLDRSPFQDDIHDWHFFTMRPTSEHIVSVAVYSKERERFSLNNQRVRFKGLRSSRELAAVTA